MKENSIQNPAIPIELVNAIAAIVHPYYPGMTIQKLVRVFRSLDMPQLLTGEEVCQIFKLTRSTLWRLEQEGVITIKKVKIGQNVRYSREEVAEIARHGTISAEELEEIEELKEA